MTATLDSDVRTALMEAVRVANRGLPATMKVPYQSLADHLYTHWFTRHITRPSGTAWSLEDRPPTLVARLRGAVARTWHYEEGWRAVDVGPGGVVWAARGSESVWVAPPDYLNAARAAVPVRPGDPLLVSAKRDHVDRVNGWWSCDARLGPAPQAPMVRIYWHCRPQGAVNLVSGIVSVMDSSSQRYSMKCPAEPRLFGRADGVVVYCTPDTYAVVRSQLRDLHGRTVDDLEDAVPPLTLRLGRGVAAAEDPMDGQSFGQSRCAAVADGLRRGWDAGLTDPAELADLIQSVLPAHGINARRPYLRVGSQADLLRPW